MRYANHYNYISKIRHILLASGTQGIAQHELNQRTRTKVFQSAYLKDTLETWESKGWIQVFKVKGISKHPKMMVRATTKLRDEWANFQLEQPAPPEVKLSQVTDLFRDAS